MSKIYILGAFLFLTFQSIGQSLPYKEISSKQGLPNSNIYFIYQDRKGFNWFCTDNGTARWDGRRFKNYSIEDGLPNSFTFKINQDKADRYWISTMSNQLSFIKNNHVFNTVNYPVLAKFNIVMGTQIIELDSFLYFQIQKKDSITTFYKVKTMDDNFTILDSISLEEFYDQVIAIFEKGNLKTRIYLDEHNKNVLIKKYNGTFNYIDDSMLIVKDITSKKANYFNRLTNEFASKHQLKENHLGLFSFGQVSHFPDKLTIKIKQKNYNVEAYTEKYMTTDNEQNLYFFNKSGFGLIPHNYIVTKRIPNQDFTNLIIHKNSILLTSLNTLYNDKTGLSYRYASDNTHRVNDIVSLGNNLVLTSSLGKFYFNFNTNKFTKSKQKDSSGNKNLFKLSETEHISSSSSDLYYVNNNNLKIIRNKRCYSILVDNQNTIWVSTLDGIEYAPFDKNNEGNSTFKTLKLSRNQNSFSNNISQGPHNSIIFSTGDGLKILANNKIYSCPFLVKTYCQKAIYSPKEDDIYTATDKGLFQFKFDPKFLEPFQKLRVFNEEDGLLSNEIRDVDIQGDSIYVLCSEGYSIINTQLVENKRRKIPLYYDFVTLKDSTYFDLKDKFSYKDNLFLVNFSAVYFKRNSRLMYHYILDGEKKYELTSDKEFIDLIALPPGDYLLKVKAFDQDYPSIESDWLEYRFEISPPFWATYWFYGIMACLIGLIIFYFSKKYLEFERNKIKEEAKLSMTLSGLELKSLRAQMNPHFMFNCLNSIKDFLYKKDFESSSRYLSKFASLIRKSLNMSRSNYIYLEDEIEFLENYIVLERMRFSNKFDYKISSNIDAHLNLELPTMMIQPFVENSIRHGQIGNLNYQGQLFIFFDYTENLLKCTIFDNGIGFKKGLQAKENKLNEEESKAMSIFEERIDLYNQSYEMNIHFDIEDNSIRGEKGTTVTLLINMNPESND